MERATCSSHENLVSNTDRVEALKEQAGIILDYELVSHGTRDTKTLLRR
jgi:hypothetical protein